MAGSPIMIFQNGRLGSHTWQAGPLHTSGCRRCRRIKSSSMRSAALLLCLGAARGALELTPDNFDEVVFSNGKKAAFVKFLAPW